MANRVSNKSTFEEGIPSPKSPKVEIDEKIYELATANLIEFGKWLASLSIKFEAGVTMLNAGALGLHISYVPESNQLHLVSPLLSGPSANQQLYERLLDFSLHRKSSCGVHMDPQTQSIQMDYFVNLVGSDEFELIKVAPRFLEEVKALRQLATGDSQVVDVLP